MTDHEIVPPQPGEACSECGLTIDDSSTCDPHHITVDGVELECAPFGSERRWDEHDVERPVPGEDVCAGCGVDVGGAHHYGCPVEECPVPGCRWQLILCHHAAVSPRRRRHRRSAR